MRPRRVGPFCSAKGRRRSHSGVRTDRGTSTRRVSADMTQTIETRPVEWKEDHKAWQRADMVLFTQAAEREDVDKPLTQHCLSYAF